MDQTKHNKHDDSPPDMGPLAKYADKFPCPFVARARVHIFTGGAIMPKTLQNDESRNKGPRKVLVMNGKRVYPVPFLLEYLNKRGVTEINVDPISQF